jgi:hypothetical protein
MRIISRDEAFTSLLKHFFTGIPCKRGHIAQRFVSNGGCVECLNKVHPVAFTKQAEKGNAITIPPLVLRGIARKSDDYKKAIHARMGQLLPAIAAELDEFLASGVKEDVNFANNVYHACMERPLTGWFKASPALAPHPDDDDPYILTPKAVAEGFSIDTALDWQARGWTIELLITHGYLVRKS